MIFLDQFLKQFPSGWCHQGAPHPRPPDHSPVPDTRPCRRTCGTIPRDGKPKVFTVDDGGWAGGCCGLSEVI